MAKINTICVQEGYKPKKGEPRVTPIVQSTTFYYEKASQLADLFDLKTDGFFYTRIANPTVDVLEKKVSALEGGVGGLACASGQAATLLTILNVCSAGDNIVASNSIYGGTHNLMNVTLRKYGIEARFFNPDASEEKIEELIDDKTKLIFGETIANPSMIVLDFEKIARIAKKHKIIFVVDNTLATAVLIRPLEYGANVVVYSSSKYLDGHAVALGGVIVDLGNFDYNNNKRYKDFYIPDESYHGVKYYQNKSPFTTKARVQLLRDLGATMAPQTAFLTILGVETLGLRMARHSENTKEIARFLSKHPKVAWVNSPYLEENKYHKLALKYLPNGCGGMLSFGIKGGLDKVAVFLENLKLLSLVTHIADLRSSVLHPASTTHRQMSSSDLEKCGVGSDLIRLSIGIEDISDIIEDIKQALEKV
ncbi:MAG: O-acetylhomoserine aminocarboxypropyltransferase/cysteine synthase family protein [Bacilli bacterium]|jgi:O-acetylhomoserine (thiol)-lyase